MEGRREGGRGGREGKEVENEGERREGGRGDRKRKEGSKG